MTDSGCNGCVPEIDFEEVGFSLCEANALFNTQHKCGVQIPVLLDPYLRFREICKIISGNEALANLARNAGSSQCQADPLNLQPVT